MLKIVILSMVIFGCLFGCKKYSNSLKGAREYIEDNKLTIYQIVKMSDSELINEKIIDNDIHNIYSLSKNFTATAIGILIDRKELSLDTNVYDLFSDEYAMNEVWKQVKIKHLLTQTTGITKGFLDIDNEDINDKEAFPDDDYLITVFNHYPEKEPGTYFCYSDSNYYLLARIVTKVSGVNYDSFMIDEIFKPLGIKNYYFETDKLGHSMGATGIYLTAMDCAKLGYLYLEKGVYNNLRILSESFVNDAIFKHVKRSDDSYYGYSFWLGESDNYFYGSGMLGQKILVLKDTQEVFAWLANGKSLDIDEAFEYLYKDN